MLRVSDQEFTAVSALPAAERYVHMIKRVADTEEVWSLRGPGGWVVAGNDARELLPVWPHPRYAAACATGPWAGTEPAAIALADWLRTWLPGMERDTRAISSFPTVDGRAAVVEPAQMRTDLEAELERYE